MDPADRWHLTLAALLGEPLPELPDMPGRKHTAPPERRDAVAAAWEKLHRRTSGASSAWSWSMSKSHHGAGGR